MSLIVIYSVFFLVGVVLVILAVLVSFIGFQWEEKMSSFECGFVSFWGARLAFSLQFFLVAMIFLVFDVEIALILPIPVIFWGSCGEVVFWILVVFVMVLLGGLYYEWGSGVLDWGY